MAWSGPDRHRHRVSYRASRNTEPTESIDTKRHSDIRKRLRAQRTEWQPADAHDPAVGAQGPGRQGREDQDPGTEGKPAAARRLHPRLHDHAEEAELGAAQGCPRAPDEPGRGHGLHPWRRAQPAGALDRAGPRWPGEGP